MMDGIFKRKRKIKKIIFKRKKNMMDDNFIHQNMM